MDGGYVLNFSNRGFRNFVVDAVGIDIYDDKYGEGGGSKANRLRAFWSKESDAVVGRLLEQLVGWAVIEQDFQAESSTGAEECMKIAKRLLTAAPELELPARHDGNFPTLFRAVRDAIRDGRPAEGIDRLHTYLVASVCQSHDISPSRDKPLNSLMGEYVKALRAAGGLQSGMAEKILKSSISVITAYDDVRNNQSLAHDNEVLSADEALLILSHVAATIRFIDSIETREMP
jgi:hypothetical protein